MEDRGHRARTYSPPGGRPRDVPAFVHLWIYTVIANLGTQTQSVAAGWLMTDLGSSGQVALIQSFISLPLMFFAMPAGVLADLFDKWTIVNVAYLVMFGGALLSALMGLAHVLTPWTLLLLCAVFGTGTALFGPTSMAAVGDVLPRAQIGAGVASLSVAFNLSRSVGPALGGGLVALSGPAWVFGGNAAACGAVIFLLARNGRRAPVSLGTLSFQSFRLLLGEGLTFGMKDRVMRIITLRIFAFAVCASPIWAFLPLIARRQLGGNAMIFGVIASAMGLGALAVSMSIRRLLGRFEREIISRIAAISMGCALLTLPLVHLWPVVTLQLFVAGASWVGSLTVFNIAVQANAGPQLAGRAMGLFYTSIFGGLAIGSWLFGQLAQRSSMPFALVLSGVLVLVTLSTSLRWPLPDSEVSLQPLEKAKIHE